MAFFNTLSEEEKRRNQSTSQLVTPSGSAPVAAGSVEPTAPKAPSSNSSGQFTNLTRYLDENKPQAQQLANQVGTTIDDKVNKTSSELDKAPGEMQTIFNQVPQADIIQQAASDPVNFVKDENNVNLFNTARNAEYTGPESFNQSTIGQNINSYLQDASRFRNINNDEQVRRQAIEDTQSNKRTGITGLNNVFLQNNDQAAQRLAQSVAPIDTLEQRVGEKDQMFTQGVDQARQTAQDTRDTFTQLFTGDNSVQNQFRNDLDNRVSQTRGQLTNQKDSILNKLTAETLGTRYENQRLTDNEIAAMGLTRDQFDRLQNDIRTLEQTFTTNNDPNKYKTYGTAQQFIADNVDFNKYITQQEADATVNRQNVATQEDLAMQAALQQLMGADETLLRDEIGGAPNSLVQFDYDQARNEIQQWIKTLQGDKK